MKKSIVLLLPLLLLAACARLPEHLPGAHLAHSPQIQRTLARADHHYGITAGPWPAQQWWEAAQLPALDHLIQVALRKNPSLQLASTRILAAKAMTAEQQAALLPQFSAGAALTQEHFSQNGLHLQANGKSFTYTAINPLELRYHLDLWGRDSDQVRAALGQVRVHQADYAEAKLQLEKQLAWHYFLLAGETRQLHLAERLENLQKSLLQLEKQRWQDGLNNARPVYAQTESYGSARQSVAQLRAAIVQQRYVLAALAGHGPDWGRNIGVEPLPDFSTINIPRQLPLRLISHRPDMVAARWEIEVAAQQVGAARAAFYPDVNIALFAGWNSIDLGDLFSPGNLAHAIGPVVSLPIFEGGKLRARLKAQNALYLAAQDHYRHTILSAVREIAGHLASWQKYRQQIQEQTRMSKAASQDSALATAAFHSGTTNKISVYRSRIREINLQNQQITLQIHNAQSWVLLNVALGGGYTVEKKPA
ncbi:efflux transporter outer membrane subunit [Acidithiobacillus thiooxidans]|uniref:efflux transporter outer membrane subunit n=1 Tax=Acidithiobacillus thiooxidans TaxID=930 RepID=UPI003566E1CB